VSEIEGAGLAGNGTPRANGTPGGDDAPGRDGLPAPAIVYLDVDDEITSAAARLRRLDTERVVLVLPYGSRIATSRINFRLLAREATARGKRLEIVAADASARALAGTAGLPVHASVAAFESGGADTAAGSPGAGGGSPGGEGGGSAEYPVARVVPAPSTDLTETRVLATPRAGEPVPRVGRARPPVRARTAIGAALVLAAVVGAGALAAILYLPSATIVLTPASEAIGPLALTVEARTDVASPDPSSLVVPAREFTFDLEATQTFTTTGVKVTETKATGNVTFTNCNTAFNGDVTIPEGSRVATKSGIGFLTIAPLTVKRATIKSCRTGSVAVEAEEAGPASNVGADTIVRVPPADYGGPIFVTNDKPTSGGSRQETPQVSQEDVDAALATLTQALRDDLDARVAEPTGVPEGTTLLDATARVGETTPSVDPSTLVGQEVGSFELGATATGTVVGVDSSPVEALAAARLASRVQPGWQLVDGSTSIEVGRPIVSGDTITFDATASARRVRVVDREALLAQIRGLGLPAARALLEAYGEVDIQLWPGWVTTIPGDTGRISLTITGPSPVPGPSPTPGPASPGAS
jgi:hypothetical protein